MSAAGAWPESAFWDYSLALYGREGVEGACLELQRRHALDVNLLLLCCWLAASGIELDRPGLEHARDMAESWQREVVRPLRAIRERLKHRLEQPEPGSIPAAWPDLARRLRAAILALELDGEHLEQLTLAGAVAGPVATPGIGLACRNLARYRRFEEADRPALAVLLRAAFPEADETGVRAGLNDLAGGSPGPR